MSLINEFKEWQDKLKALAEEGDALSERIADLERQNAELRQQLAENTNGGDGFQALKDIYDDGFHICPGSFGQSREEECLFCLNFLLNKGHK
ncbi:MAG: DUF972 family protein [Firmicutes bacterium]|nr:DUF972 family protein [Bacillota bacterium]